MAKINLLPWRVERSEHRAQANSSGLTLGGARLMAKINLLPWRVERSEHRAQANSSGLTLGGLD